MTIFTNNRIHERRQFQLAPQRLQPNIFCPPHSVQLVLNTTYTYGPYVSCISHWDYEQKPYMVVQHSCVPTQHFHHEQNSLADDPLLCLSQKILCPSSPKWRLNNARTKNFSNTMLHESLTPLPPSQKKSKEEILTEQVPIVSLLPKIIRHKKKSHNH